MKHVSETLHYAAHRFNLVNGAGGRLVARRQVTGPVPPQMLRSVQHIADPATVKEFATADGEVISRKVCALGEVACWLRSDLADAAEAALEHEAAEHRRVIAEVADYARATRQHSRDQSAQTYVLNSSLLHAAARHQARIGRLYDMNSRGDRVRGNLVAALDRAKKAEGAK